MLKYPSVQATRGEGAQVLVARRKSKVEWFGFGKIKIGAFANLLESDASSQKYCTINWKEFICFGFCLAWPVAHISRCVDLILRWGGLVVLAGYFCFAIGLSVPLLMLLLFLGSYTKRSYIALWEMVPIFKGMAWTLSLFSVSLEFFNVALAGLASMYLGDLLNLHVPWEDCNFQEATERCYNMFPKNRYNKTCCFHDCTEELLANQVYFPAHEYFLKNKLHAPDSYGNYSGIGELQSKWATHVLFEWFVIFFLSSLGFRRFKGAISFLFIIFSIIFFLPTIGIATFFSSTYSVPVVMSSSFGNFMSSEFWMDILSHSFCREVPGNYVLLGALAPAAMVPNVDVFNIYSLKFLFLIMIMICVSIGVQAVQLHYKIEDVTCVPVNGLSLLFAIIPDILTRVFVPHIPLIIWFLGLWFLGMASAVYTMTAFLDALIEALPGIEQIRILFNAILCSVCFLFNLMFLTSVHLAMEELWTETLFTVVTILIFFLFTIAVFMYATANIANDFHFTYGNILGDYWMYSLKFTALLTFLCVTILITEKLHTSYRYTPNMVTSIICYVFGVMMLLPIVFVAIWIYMKYKNQENAELSIMPTERWGPPGAAEKIARSKFHPQREVQFRSEGQNCRHNCLLNSQELKKEIKLWKRNQRRLLYLSSNERMSQQLPAM